MTVKWTGGANTAFNIYLIDFDLWTVAASAGSVMNSGGGTHTYNWTLPSNLTCNRRHEFYIGNATDWAYGPVFRLKCDIKFSIARSGTNYQLTLTNGSYNFVPLISPASQQTHSVPNFRFDLVLAGTTNTLATSSGSGPGTWSIAPNLPFTSPKNVTLNFRLNTQTTIAPNQTIGTYTLKATANGPALCGDGKIQVFDQIAGGNHDGIDDTAPADNTAICAQ